MDLRKLIWFLILVSSVSFLALRLDPVSVLAQSGSQPLSMETSGDYHSVLSTWLLQEYQDNHEFFQVITASQMSGGTERVVTMEQENVIVREIKAGERLQFHVQVATKGLYQIHVEYLPLANNHQELEMELMVNQQFLYAEMRQITLPKFWRQTTTSFPTDRFGNDFFASQEVKNNWHIAHLQDPLGLYTEGLYFELEAGTNHLEFLAKKATIQFRSITVTGTQVIPDYETYHNKHSLELPRLHIEMEAELPTYKSDSTIQAGVSRDLLVTPFEVSTLRLNVIQASTFQSPKQTLFYEIDVPESGNYALTLKLMQNQKVNGIVYRTLRINGRIPFEEARNIAIPYANEWVNFTLGDGGKPYELYLEKGVNTISLSVSFEPYREMLLSLQHDLLWINQTALDIRKLTGNQLDKDRDWNLLEFLPGMDQALFEMSQRLTAHFLTLEEMNATKKLSEAQSQLRLAIRNLEFLAKNPNEIPKNIALLSASPASIAQTLGFVINDLGTAPLSMDKFYLHTEMDLPPANGGFFAKLWISIQRFFLSFFDERYQLTAASDELDVWVNRPKLYVDLIQKLADEEFTKQTGIKVKISVLADEGKLILANSANRNPDVALGISSWLPFDLGIRGALTPITNFTAKENFTDTLNLYPAQALIPFVYDEALYGLPDTQNVYLLFYRTDILSTLDINVPTTWEEVTEIMPVLRRFGMNFALPLSSATSLKSYDSTLPFLFQYGSSVYRSDGFGANLNNASSIQALTMMTELYTIYSLEQTVSNFYNDFRLGKAPIGVGDFGMYIRLQNAAPDIKGLWSIAPIPGVKQEDNTIRRDAPGAQTANVVFKNTTKADESWQFLSWWSQTNTQVMFANYLLASLGKEYLWNSANLAAFSQSGYDEQDLQVMLEQWEHLHELPKIPGSYQVELEISNIWNSVVLNRANLRVRLNDALIRMDREIAKKMSEFGYMNKQGQIIKPYVLASEEWVKNLQEGGQNND